MFQKFCWVWISLLPVLSLAQPVHIIPQPVSITVQQGSFVMDDQASLQFDATDKDLQAAADFFNSCISHLSGKSLPVNIAAPKAIELKIAATPEIGLEGYLLSVSPSAIVITANTKTGIVYGMQSLLQTLPAIRTNATLSVPAMQVKDYPRFGWRGMHLDVSRHFFSPELVKQYIDLMAGYKMNVFHWHLTDDQGWRMEIKKYPKLTEVGAWRVDETAKPWTERPQAKEGQLATYGGYYTQQQIKDIVAYAARRNITIVPEIEMPGHVAASVAAYPWLSCGQRPQLPMTGGNYTGMASGYCAGNDSVFLFLEDVLAETINLFPSKYIHIGGDEMDKAPWKTCPKCQARKKAEGLKDEDELQSYFIRRIERFVAGRGRKIIGWDEILEGGLAPGAAVMSWRGEAGSIEAAKMGHDVVMTPGSPLYFDQYQSDPATEPLAIGGFNPLKKVYDYDPIPAGLTPAQAKHVMGAQANLWAEYITTPEQVLYMVLPRMLALSEVVWSPRESRNWERFNEHLQTHLRGFEQKGLRHSKGNTKVNIRPASQSGRLHVALSTELYRGTIFYTLDGSMPTPQSLQYTAPIRIDSSVMLKAVTVAGGRVMSTVPAQQAFALHKAVGRNVTYTYPTSRFYPADGPNSLTDGVRGTTAVGKFWHGIAGKDLVATVNLEAVNTISTIGLGCLQHYADWIMMPQWVKFEVSEDGLNYKEVQTVHNAVPANEKSAVIKDFVAHFAPLKARYIRVTAKALEALSAGHPGAGKPAWIFADELIVR